jgi:hypothetical protein
MHPTLSVFEPCLSHEHKQNHSAKLKELRTGATHQLWHGHRYARESYLVMSSPSKRASSSPICKAPCHKGDARASIMLPFTDTIKSNREPSVNVQSASTSRDPNHRQHTHLEVYFLEQGAFRDSSAFQSTSESYLMSRTFYIVMLLRCRTGSTPYAPVS